MIDLRCSFLVVSSGKPCGQVEAHLPAEDAQRAGAGAVAALHAVGQDVGQQVEVLPLRMISPGGEVRREAAMAFMVSTLPGPGRIT